MSIAENAYLAFSYFTQWVNHTMLWRNKRTCSNNSISFESQLVALDESNYCNSLNWSGCTHLLVSLFFIFLLHYVRLGIRENAKLVYVIQSDWGDMYRDILRRLFCAAGSACVVGHISQCSPAPVRGVRGVGSWKMTSWLLRYSTHENVGPESSRARPLSSPAAASSTNWTIVNPFHGTSAIVTWHGIIVFTEILYFVRIRYFKERLTWKFRILPYSADAITNTWWVIGYDFVQSKCIYCIHLCTRYVFVAKVPWRTVCLYI